MRIYANDLTTAHKIIDKKTEDIVTIDYVEYDELKDRIIVMGYFESDGTDWHRIYDGSDTVRIVA
jgi:ribosomal silencing factor RsfS